MSEERIIRVNEYQHNDLWVAQVQADLHIFGDWDDLEPAPKHTDAEYNEVALVAHKEYDRNFLLECKNDELKAKLDELREADADWKEICERLRAENERLKDIIADLKEEFGVGRVVTDRWKEAKR